MGHIDANAPGARDAAAAALTLIVSEAHLAAELTAAYLARIGVHPAAEGEGSGPGLPAGFLRELGAVLRIATWEAAGLRDHLDADLPPAAEALRDLFRRLAEDPGGFGRAAGPSPLVRRVMMAALRRLAWRGRADLGADAAIAPLEAESGLDALAEFLYRHRRRGVPPGP